MSYALTNPQRVAGVIAQSGYIPHESGLQIDEAGIQGKPFIVTHGIQDPCSPWTGLAAAETHCKNLMSTRLSRIQHGAQPSPKSLAVINTWLENKLS